MAIESLGTVLESPQQQVSQAGVGQDDLFKILLTQLTYQDPLKPLDNQEFIAQLAQFTDLEQNRQINDKMEALLTVQSADQSIGLIGRSVQVRSENGGSDIGTVTTITFERGEPKLTIKKGDGVFLRDVNLSQVFLVRKEGETQ